NAPIPQNQDGWTPDIGQAYEIQKGVVALRLSRGETLAGAKMALTNPAARTALGITESPMGWLTDVMAVPDGADWPLAPRNFPRLEAEVAFRLKRPLSGEVTLGQAAAAVDQVMPAIELVDGRYSTKDLVVADLVADNASACGYVLGPASALPDNLDALAVTVTVQGKEIFRGDTKSINGHPLQSLCDAARLAARAGRQLEAGWIVLAGSACPPTPIEGPGKITVTVQGLGDVSVFAR
ncbi:MAG: fumarylacetoacetate hydrolase family protein, partial [Burkholderiaceae bacterium]